YARELTMAPSAYFKRQCFVSVECDEEPVKHVIDAVGDDRIVFSTDFPHGDSKFPRAVESFLRLPISTESKRKILWDNCAAYYGFPAGRRRRHDGPRGGPEGRMGMSILVIGGTGFIGPRLMRRLIDRGESVVCMDLNPGAVSLFAEMPSRAAVIRGDVTRFG